MKSWLEKNGIEMYSIHKKSAITERFIRTLKTKIYKCLTSVSKNVYTDKLDDVVSRYNNTYHRTIKIKPVDVKWSTFINPGKGMNNKNPICKSLYSKLV